ncbi:MAG: hypothetical protein ACXWNE_12045, partial [Candidatus Binataceae bacterium]
EQPQCGAAAIRIAVAPEVKHETGCKGSGEQSDYRAASTAKNHSAQLQDKESQIATFANSAFSSPPE